MAIKAAYSAEGSDLSCPFCGLSAELPKSEGMIFQCPADLGGCGKKSCRECGRKPHPETPRCEDVESDLGTRSAPWSRRP